MKKHFIIAALVFLPTILMAETKTFIREYTYQASESDSKITARAKALSEVKRLLLEEIGVYMESYTNYTTQDENGEVTKDFLHNEIKSMSAGITETKIVEEVWNGVQYFIRAEIEVDPTDVARKITATLEKRKSDVVIDSLRMLLSSSQTLSLQKNEEVKALQAKYDAQTAQVQQQIDKVNELKTQLQNLQTKLSNYQQEEKQLTSKIQQIEARIREASNTVLENARIGMTYSELISVCGKPRSIDYKYLNYGKVWIELSDIPHSTSEPIVVKGAIVTARYDISSRPNVIKQP